MNFELEKSIPLKSLLEATSAKILTDKTQYLIKKVVTDTRSYKGKGGIFFAIKGKNFDGHNFINQIIKDIDFVVISNKEAIIDKYKKKFIIVKDTTLAFDKLALLYRSSFPKLKVVAVAGSNGKTTTKELISFIFSKKYNVVSTYSNQNNLLGVAYTLFSINKKTEYCVVEIGISQICEMDILASTVKPDAAVITNIGKEHLEFLGSLENVFIEETKIIRYLNKNGILVLNKDDQFLKTIGWVGEKKWYSIHIDNADVYTAEIKQNIDYTQLEIVIKDPLGLKLKSPPIQTKLLGIHNVYNILAAITCCFFFGIYDFRVISEAISEFEPVDMRWKIYKIKNNVIIDESYNANPTSMQTAILEFMKIFKEKQKVLVLGDMLELGEYSIEEHKNLKNVIDFQNIEKLFIVGKYMKFLYESLTPAQKQKTVYYENKDELVSEIINLINLEKNLYFLFKSSHSVGLFEVVKKIKCIENYK